MTTLSERHSALVTDNDDPDRRGRLRVSCQSLVGANQELPHWVEPAPFFTSVGGFGSLFTPVPGSTVELVVDVSDPELDESPFERFMDNPSMRWRPAPFTSPNGNNPLPDQLVTNYPNRRGFKTPSGHHLIFDDTSGSEIILLAHSDGQAVISIERAGVLKLKALNEVGSNPTEFIGLGAVLQTFVNVFFSWVPVPNDGGAALQTALLAAFPLGAPTVASATQKVAT